MHPQIGCPHGCFREVLELTVFGGVMCQALAERLVGQLEEQARRDRSCVRTRTDSLMKSIARSRLRERKGRKKGQKRTT